MATDLKTVYDHPARVLNTYAADAYARDGDTSARGNAYSTAATRLLGYELENGITFAALDNETLDAVRAAWQQVTSGEGNQGLAMADLVGEIRDLLGLEE